MLSKPRSYPTERCGICAWSRALLSPRTPPFLALNEPETSLHSDLLPALAELIADAGERGQVLVTTHAEALATALEKRRETSTVRLSKRDGATVVVAD